MGIIMIEKKQFTRRAAVSSTLSLTASGAVLLALNGCGEVEDEIALCANPNSLSFSENSIRQANNYTEVTPHADKNCLNCAFFMPEQAGTSGAISDCGHCSIFEGLADKDGYCDSWSTKDTGQG